jgi:hypothetical protein
MFGLPEPAFMPCSECGESLARAERDEHVCDRDRWVDYQLLQQKQAIERLEADLRDYLESPEGRFRAWDAERRRTEEDDD